MQVLSARQLFTDYFSNRSPAGRKHDLKDAERLVRRLIANNGEIGPQKQKARSATPRPGN